MGKPLLSLSLLLVMIFSLTQMAVVLATQARTLDLLDDTQAAVRNLSVCERPCVLGIGMNIEQEAALQILRSNEWVGAISSEAFATRQGPSTVVRWKWSGKQPAYIDAAQQGLLITEQFSGNIAEVVTSISLQTTLRFADLYQILGETNSGAMSVSGGSGAHIQYVAAYYDAETVTLFSIGTNIPCGFSWMRYWNTVAVVNLSSHVGRSTIVSPDQLPKVC